MWIRGPREVAGRCEVRLFVVHPSECLVRRFEAFGLVAARPWGWAGGTVVRVPEEFWSQAATAAVAIPEALEEAASLVVATGFPPQSFALPCFSSVYSRGNFADGVAKRGEGAGQPARSRLG